MESNQKLIITILNSLNILLTGILIISYFTSTKLRHHPAGIIVSLAFCELATSYHTTIFTWGNVNVVNTLTIDKMRIWSMVGLKDHVLNITCGINICIFTFGVICGIFYNLILCIDLILSLHNPFGVASRRMPWFHLSVGLVSFIFAGYISISNIYETCEIVNCTKSTFKSNEEFYDCLKYYHICQQGDYGKFIECAHSYATNMEEFEAKNKLDFVFDYRDLILPVFEVYFVVGLVSVVYGVYRLKKGLKISNMALKKSLLRHIWYVGVNTFMFGYMVFALYVKDYYDGNEEFVNFVYDVASYVLSLGGVVLAVIRCMNENFRYKIISGKLFVNEDLDETQDDNEWNKSIVDTSIELKAELASNIFFSLYKVYERSPDTYKGDNSIEFKPSMKDVKSSLLLDGIFSESNEIELTITQYCPSSFHSIIQSDGQQYESLRQSLNPNNNIDCIMSASESKGKSGSFFLKTQDEKFLIKTVKTSEINALRKMIIKYRDHLDSKRNEKSLICKIFGAFLLNLPGITPINLIIMENVAYGMKFTKIYDLKGSTLNRSTKQDSRSSNKDSVGPLKDNDFLRNKERVECDFHLIKSINQDTELLKSCNLMDYSLLLCIGTRNDDGSHVEVFRIIDYLIQYEFFKKLERAFVSLLNPRSKDRASVMNPKRYSERFNCFMARKVFKVKNN